MRAVSLTNRGGRKNNEDYVGYANSDKLWCFVVCDGLGGQSFGEVASEIVCETVCKSFKKAPELSGKALYRYIEKAASVLGEERESTKSNMSSTIVALVTDGEKAVWAHSGDSRLYYISKKRISQITDDHSIAFRDFKEGIITFDEIRTSPNQNKLLSSISDIDDLNFDVSEVIDLKKGDAFVLCTDGFWEYVYEDDIEKSFAKTKSPKEWLEKMLESGKSASELISQSDMGSVSEEDLRQYCRQAIEGNPNAVRDYLGGKEKALKALLGHVMKATRGRADAQAAEAVLTELIRSS